MVRNEGVNIKRNEGVRLIRNLHLTLRREIVAFVDKMLASSTGVIKQLDEAALVGYRGSLATGIKYKTGALFNPSDFDVDAFIVSNKLAMNFTNKTFRNGRDIGLRNISNSLESSFKNLPGYRSDKPFTFRIFTAKEFGSIVMKTGYKLFN